MQLWSRLIEKCGLYCANKVKNSNFQYFRGNNRGVTGRISLIIELFWDLVPINTSCKFGPDWFRNVVSIGLTRKELTDAWTHARRPSCHNISPSGLQPVKVKKKQKKTKNILMYIFFLEIQNLSVLKILLVSTVGIKQFLFIHFKNFAIPAGRHQTLFSIYLFTEFYFILVFISLYSLQDHFHHLSPVILVRV